MSTCKRTKWFFLVKNRKSIFNHTLDGFVSELPDRNNGRGREAILTVKSMMHESKKETFYYNEKKEKESWGIWGIQKCKFRRICSKNKVLRGKKNEKGGREVGWGGEGRKINHEKYKTY